MNQPCDYRRLTLRAWAIDVGSAGQYAGVAQIGRAAIMRRVEVRSLPLAIKRKTRLQTWKQVSPACFFLCKKRASTVFLALLPAVLFVIQGERTRKESNGHERISGNARLNG